MSAFWMSVDADNIHDNETTWRQQQQKENTCNNTKTSCETTVQSAVNTENILIYFYLFQKFNSDIINKPCHKKVKELKANCSSLKSS